MAGRRLGRGRLMTSDARDCRSSLSRRPHAGLPRLFYGKARGGGRRRPPAVARARSSALGGTARPRRRRCAGTVLLGLAVLWLLAMAAHAQQAAPSPPLLVVISLDGLRPDYITAADAHGARVPNLRRFLREGSFAEGVLGVIPTVTYPSHTTLARIGSAPAGRRLPLPTSAAGTAACSAERTSPASPRSGLTPRPPRCSSLSRAVSPSVRAFVAPVVLSANRRLHRPLSFTHPSTLPRTAKADGKLTRAQPECGLPVRSAKHRRSQDAAWCHATESDLSDQMRFQPNDALPLLVVLAMKRPSLEARESNIQRCRDSCSDSPDLVPPVNDHALTDDASGSSILICDENI